MTQAHRMAMLKAAVTRLALRAVVEQVATLSPPRIKATRRYYPRGTTPTNVVKPPLLPVGKVRSPNPSQLELLRWIAGYVAELGYAPTFAEMGQHIGATLVAAICRMDTLRRKGLATYRRRSPRSIELTDAGKAAIA